MKLVFPDDRDQDNRGTGRGEPSYARPNKIPRSRMACLPCRAKRSKCGTRPPGPCQNCIEKQVQCTWPEVDGRSARGKNHTSSTGRSQATASSSSSAHQGQQPSSQPPLYDAARHNVAAHVANAPSLSNETYGQPDSFHWNEPPNAYGAGPSSQMRDTSAVRPAQDPAMMVYPPLSKDKTEFWSNDSIWDTFTYPLSQQVNDRPLPAPTPHPTNSADQLQPQPQGLNAHITPINVPPTVDPQQLVWAFSSRLPSVEMSGLSSTENTPPGQPVVHPPGKHDKQKPKADDQIVKITWWRPHGKTAIAPGLRKITLKVKIDRQSTTSQNVSPINDLQDFDPGIDIFEPNGMPVKPIMRHILQIFSTHYECCFPYLDSTSLLQQLETDTGSVFLFNSIAGFVARFSNSPYIARPGLEPCEYGNVFGERAKSMLGKMFAVPSLDTIAGVCALAWSGAGNNSESELWIMVGIAARMSIDLGLHLVDHSERPAEEKRRNRLLFWAVLMLDYSLCFEVGRQTTFPHDSITQTYPTEEDIPEQMYLPINTGSTQLVERSPFLYSTRLFYRFGALINLLNRDHPTTDSSEWNATLQRYLTELMDEYASLPEDMVWNVNNLQLHSRANRATVYVWLHLWVHTVLVSQSLLESDRPRTSSGPFRGMSLAVQLHGMPLSAVWSNSARIIGEILVLCDIVNPWAYIPLELANQSLFVAASYYVREIELLGSTSGSSKDDQGLDRRLGHTFYPLEPNNHSSAILAERDRQNELSRALLVSVAKESVMTLQKGLERQTIYWNSTRWIAQTLAQRVQGISVVDLDLEKITANLETSVSNPDVGLVDREVVRSNRKE
ncbi:hypothetical protein BD324DRAFT_260361 [Kockovaella imperatae]|uniref:Zn(2)-C6 fungal-type domain-containing protein n=1 Tax=Kockovaella imperatae TaxID=4999 RepID=A0A1Y1UQ85_9TREE|nr:hypothetical protein BD324DRAFT_260361 [Kockovaella imperatae]ORX40132.1 hypothetical protein BD324DRAFT_260361 [Kockovaella imperatae]